MWKGPSSSGERAGRRRWRPARLLWLERLEERTLLSGNTLATATPLSFTAFDTAHAAAFLATPTEVDLYHVSLGAGDRVSAAISALSSGSGLVSLLRVFDAAGHQLALDDQEGGDPSLTFQAAATGDYFIGVSSALDDHYDPTVAGSGTAGSTTGLYALDLRLTPAATFQPDVTGSSFRLGGSTALPGQPVPVAFTVENRGAADPGNFQVQVLLADNQLFNSPTLVSTLARSALIPDVTGRAFSSPAGLTVTVPPGQPSGPLFIGIRIVPDPLVADADPFDKLGVHRGTDFDTLTVLTPVTSVANGTRDLSAADPGLNTLASGSLATATQTDTYSLSFTAPPPAPGQQPLNGRLTAVLTFSGSGSAPKLELLGPDHTVLLQSAGNPASITQELPPGAYSLVVSSQGGSGSYQLLTEFSQVASTPLANNLSPVFTNSGLPLEPLAVDSHPKSIVVADVNGDGIPDLVTANYGTAKYPGNSVSVLLGLGGGSFRPEQTFTVGSGPIFVAVADLNGDGKPDLIVANYGTQKTTAGNTISVLLGKGDGTFGRPQTIPVGTSPAAVAVTDLNGDGNPDLVIANAGSNSLTILLNTTKPGATAFSFNQQTIAGFLKPVSLTSPDLDGDGKPDLVVANAGGSSLTVLRNTTAPGATAFSFAWETISAGSTPVSVAAADINGDGKPDLVAGYYPGPSSSGDKVTVLLNTTTPGANPAFGPPEVLPVNASSDAVVVADLNDDGKPDLLVINNGKYTATALLNTTTPGMALSFAAQTTFRVGTLAYAAVAADVNGDGKPDLVIGNKYYSTINVFLGNGDGSFQIEPTFRVTAGPVSVAVADLNGDGKPDIAAADIFDSSVNLLLGNGDGTFAPETTLPVDAGPDAVVVADINGDGILDLVTANKYAGTVSVLLGNGDGSFQPQQSFPVGSKPSSVAVGDVDGDGIPDLVVANYGDDTVSVLLGKGDGTFRPGQTIKGFAAPTSVALADLDGDGKLDLAVANAGNGTVSVLQNMTATGSPTVAFSLKTAPSVGTHPSSVAVADLNGDGKPDLVVANYGAKKSPGNTVSVLLNQGGDSFQSQQTFTVGNYPLSVAVADLDGDGRPDIVVANETRAYASYGTVSVLLNRTAKGSPALSFSGQTAPVGLYPAAVAVGDVNGDGVPDLVAGNKYFNTVSVLLGKGDGSFTPSTPASSVGVGNTPYLKDLDSDGIPDSVVLDSAGNLLFRKGLPGGNNDFAPPVILNPGRPARDLTLVDTSTGEAIATVDAHFDPTLSTAGSFVYTVSLYTLNAGDSVSRTTAFTTSVLPTRIAAGDLNGDGRDDLVVADALADSIQVSFQQPGGTFSAPITRATGLTPSAISLVKLGGDPLADIVVTDQGSGDVSVFSNDASHSFSTTARFRASPDPYAVTSPTSTSRVVQSEAIPVSVAAGEFTGGGSNDLVVVDRGDHSFSVLPGSGGGFANPLADLTTSTSDGLAVNNLPGPVVAGDFNGDGKEDVAILMEDSAQVWIYTGDGKGHFKHTFSIAAGSLPTGLNVVRNSTTGFLDLLVGNSFGDVLRLQGNGDGTFAPPPPLTGSRVSLDVQTVAGQTRALVANQQQNHVLIETAAPNSQQFVPTQTVVASTQLPFAPPDARFFALNHNDPTLDAIVLSGAGNSVQVYRPNPGGPGYLLQTSFSVGTDPVSVTVTDLNGDGIPDLLVADQGSNDVSVLFGRYDGSGQWYATEGPRLNSGGSGPLAVTVADVTGRSGTGGPDGVPDLVVTNGASGTMTVLPGVGQGFFNATNPQSISLGGTAGAPSLAADGAGMVPVGDELVGFNLDDLAAGARVVFTSTATVDAAQVLPDGGAVVALAGGAVEELEPGVGGTLRVATTLEPLTGNPADPSALAVLETASGMEVLVTAAGEDTVFVFAAPGLPEVMLPVSAVPPGPGVEVSVPAGAPETVVVTLFTAVEAETEGGGTPAAGSTGATSAGLASSYALALAGASTPGRSSGELGHNQELEVIPEERETGIDGGRMLRDLDLYTPTPDVETNETTNRQPAPRAAEEIALASWEAYGLPSDGLSDALTPLPVSAWSWPEVPAASQPVSVSPPDAGAPSVEPPALPEGAAAADPTVDPDAEATAPESAPVDLASSVFESASDAPLLRPHRPWERDSTFLAAVAVAWSAAPAVRDREGPPPRQRPQPLL